MAAPTIPASNSQAVLTVQAGGTIPFAQAWYTFFANLLAYVSTGPVGPVPLVGVTDGSNAAAGNVGEYLSSIVNISPGVSLTSGSPSTITSLTLTAGDWDMWGEVDFGTASGSTLGAMSAALWNTPASVSVTTYPSDGGSGAAAFSQTGGLNNTTRGWTLMLGPVRVNITTGTTFYLSGLATFSPATLVAGGAIRARRRR